jgi:hypothetical protein
MRGRGNNLPVLSSPRQLRVHPRVRGCTRVIRVDLRKNIANLPNPSTGTPRKIGLAEKILWLDRDVNSCSCLIPEARLLIPTPYSDGAGGHFYKIRLLPTDRREGK